MKKFFSKLKLSEDAKITIISVFSGFVLGALVMILTGHNPIVGYGALFDGVFGSPRKIGELLVASMPILMTALAVGFAFKTGLFNIGAEGQLVAGSVAAACVALLVPAPKIIHVILIIAAAAVAGGLWAAIPGIIKAKLNISEVVISIMLNYGALYLGNMVIKTCLPMSTTVVTQQFPESALLDSAFLQSITGGSRLNWGVVIVILSIVLYWFILEKTKFGFELKSVGANRNASEYAGMKVTRNIVLSMMISGAFAGIGGAILTTGTFSVGRVLTANEGFGFDGLAVALLGSSSAGGITWAGLLFGGLKAGSSAMSLSSVPKEISSIIIASIVIMISMKAGISIWLHYFRDKKRKKRPEPLDPCTPATGEEGIQ